MASWTKHLDKEQHPTDTTRNRSFFEREGHSLADYHSWLHEEYGENESMSHSHDEHGQLLFHDRRQQHNHAYNPANSHSLRPEGECPSCDAMWKGARAQVPSDPFAGLG